MPIIRTASWRAPWTKEVRKRAAQWERVLDRDPRLSRTLDVPELQGKPLPRGVRIVLYERIRRLGTVSGATAARARAGKLPA